MDNLTAIVGSSHLEFFSLGSIIRDNGSIKGHVLHPLFPECSILKVIYENYCLRVILCALEMATTDGKAANNPRNLKFLFLRLHFFKFALRLFTSNGDRDITK